MKPYKFKRYIGLHENFLWFKDAYSHEYHVTLKQNHLRGPRAAFLSLIKTHLVGIFIPIGIICFLKRYAHDPGSYFKAKVILNLMLRSQYNQEVQLMKEVLMVLKYLTI